MYCFLSKDLNVLSIIKIRCCVEFFGLSTHFKLYANAKSKLSHDVAYLFLFFSDNVPTSMLIVRFLEILGVILLSFALLSRVVAHYRMRNPEDTFIWDGILTVISGMYTLVKVMSKHRPGTGTIIIEILSSKQKWKITKPQIDIIQREFSK